MKAVASFVSIGSAILVFCLAPEARSAEIPKNKKEVCLDAEPLCEGYLRLPGDDSVTMRSILDFVGARTCRDLNKIAAKKIASAKGVLLEIDKEERRRGRPCQVINGLDLSKKEIRSLRPLTAFAHKGAVNLANNAITDDALKALSSLVMLNYHEEFPIDLSNNLLRKAEILNSLKLQFFKVDGNQIDPKSSEPHPVTFRSRPIVPFWTTHRLIFRPKFCFPIRFSISVPPFIAF